MGRDMRECPATSPTTSDGGGRPPSLDTALRHLGTGATMRLVATGVNGLCGVATVAVAVRLLGTSAYGRLAFFLTVVALLTGMSRVGWGLATVRGVSVAATADDDAAIRRTGSAATALARLTSVVGVLVLVGVVLTTGLDLDPAARIALAVGLALTVVSANEAAAAASVARGLGRVALAEIPELTVSVIRLALLVLLAVAGARSLGPIGVMLAGTGLAALVAARFVTRACLRQRSGLSDVDSSDPHTGAVGDLLRASLPFVVQGLAVMAVARFDVLVLGFTASRSDVGQYEGTLRVVERLLQFLPFLLLPQFLAAAATLWSQGHHADFGRMYRTVSRLSYALAFPVVLALAAFPEAILHALYGDRFPVRSALVWVLLLGFFPYAVLATTWSALASTGATGVLVRVSTLTFVVMLTSALVLIPAFGAIGAAIATALSLVTHQVAVSVFLHRRAGLHAIDAALLRMAAMSIAFLGLALGLRHLLLGSPLWSVTLAVAGLAGAWLAAVWGLGGIRPRAVLDLVRRTAPATPAVVG
ncbi:MAG: hypothetical protein QOD63_1193 [Actinomycetota bacterium]|nr:hypothetical protein [Actinomycetota bacterium]